MRTSPQAEHERHVILDKVKAQYDPGSSRPHLYETFEESGRKPDAPLYEWMYNAGMGSSGFSKVQAHEDDAIKELVDAGRLVPTFEDNFYGVKKIRLIQHFDDVKFGMDEKGDILIYDLSQGSDVPGFPDQVIRPDEKHQAALDIIRKRMDFPVPSHAIVIDENPIQLLGGPVIRPIVTNAAQIELRKRQRAFHL